MKGKIVLVPFPFTDLTDAKVRPALVLNESRNDVTVAFISSKVPSSPPAMDVVIQMSHPEFHLTGLKVDSVIKLDKVATLSKRIIRGELGELGSKLKGDVNLKLRGMLKI